MARSQTARITKKYYVVLISIHKNIINKKVSSTKNEKLDEQMKLLKSFVSNSNHLV